MTDFLGASFSFFSLLKWFYVFAFFIYIIFSFVIVEQVRIMTKTLEVNFEAPLLLISYAHLLFAIGVFVFALLVL